MPAPTVSSVSNPLGSLLGGTTVAITGTNFTGVLSVTFNAVAATSITVISATSLTCITPAGVSGVASVLVTNADGTNAANSLYLYVAAVPTDTFIYLKGGSGDGFVPLWTGQYSDSNLPEQSEPYRNYVNEGGASQQLGSYPNGGVGYVNVPTLIIASGPEVQPSAMDLAMSDALLEATGTPTPPRQFGQLVTWRGYTSASGVVYHFRKVDIIGVGSRQRE